MTFSKGFLLCALAVIASASCSAQQKFPLRPGEWTSSTPDPSHPGGAPMTLLFCMNDETWTKALKGNPNCTMQQLSLTPLGGSYSLSCGGQSFQMKGMFRMVFEGTTRMITTGSMDTTINGKTTHSEAKSDFHWKSPTCNPNVDMNLRSHNSPQK
jgi:hypothetical protein